MTDSQGTVTSDWKVWNGGSNEPPEPEGTIVRIQRREDSRFEVERSKVLVGLASNFIWGWENTLENANIVAYRVEKAAPVRLNHKAFAHIAGHPVTLFVYTVDGVPDWSTATVVPMSGDNQ